MATKHPDDVIRDRPSWMTRDDYWILEHMNDPDKVTVLSPSVLAYNLDLSRNHVNRRLSEFVEYGLVERVERGYYEITPRGREFVEGNLRADALEDDTS